MKTKVILLSLVLSFGAFCSFAQTKIKGKTLYHNQVNKPLGDVLVKLVDNNGNVIDSTYSNPGGVYQFSNVSSGNYTVQTWYDEDPGGIDLEDTWLIFLHLTNLYTLSPMEFIAADVDGDNDVTWDDYWTIVLGWMVQGYPFPVGDWVFEDLSVTVGSKDVIEVGGPAGSSSGDVDGSFQPGIKPEPTLDLINDTELIADMGSEIHIPVYTDWNHPTSGLAMNFTFPESLNVLGVSSDFKNLNYSINNNVLKVVWVDNMFGGQTFEKDDPLFEIIAVTDQDFISSSVILELSEESHIMSSKGKIVNSSIYMPKIVSKQNLIGVGNISPNPVQSQTNLTFTLNKSDYCNVELLNSNGQLLRKYDSEFFEEGIVVKSIDISEFNLNPGIYFVRLSFSQAENHAQIMKFIKTE